jgi:WD40 repeat protein
VSKSSTIWTVRHSPHDRDVFALTSGDGSVSLWKYRYPEKRREKDADGDGLEYGVAGTLTKLQKTNVSPQPVNSFRWNPDLRGLAVCSSFDQAIRVLIVTKMGLL